MPNLNVFTSDKETAVTAAPTDTKYYDKVTTTHSLYVL